MSGFPPIKSGFVGLRTNFALKGRLKEEAMTNQAEKPKPCLPECKTTRFEPTWASKW